MSVSSRKASLVYIISFRTARAIPWKKIYFKCMEVYSNGGVRGATPCCRRRRKELCGVGVRKAFPVRTQNPEMTKRYKYVCVYITWV